jgi:hypothetical protein
MLRRVLLALCIIAAAQARCPDRDGVISTRELRHAIESHLPWWKRVAFQVFGGLGRVLDDCDGDGDGRLTKEESLALVGSCMETCSKKRDTVDLFQCDHI